MDLVIINSPFALAKLKQMDINAMLYFGWFNTALLKKYENMSKNTDVSFVGLITGRSKRLDYINYLEKSGINVKYYGYGSPNGIISAAEKIRIHNSSKINLNFSDVAEQTRLTRNHKICRQLKGIKGNNFEIAICGGFVLSEYAFGIKNFFEIGKEMAVFTTKEELLEKIKYYLVHEEERENIAKSGYERAIRDYDVKLAVPKLLSTIDELRKKKSYKSSEIYLDDEFIRNHTTYRILWIIQFAKARKWKFAYEELKIIFKYRKFDWYQIRIFFIEEVLDKFPKIKSFLKLIFESNRKQ